MLSYNEFINQMEERKMVKIHFLDVGEGDCTVIEHETGRVSVIDICKGNTNPVEYLDEQMNRLNRKEIFRFILTHPDMDHLTGFKDLFERFEVLNFWDRKHQKEIKEFSSESEEQDWNCYQKYRSSSEEEESPKVLTLYRGAQNKYYNEDGLHIISPTKDLEERCDKNEDWNNMSYVILHEVYGKKILYCGDSERLAWEYIKNDKLKENLENIDTLIDSIKSHIFKHYVKASFLIPYDRGTLISYLNEHSHVHETEYLENGTLITVECSEHDAQRLAEYKVKPLN